MSSHKRRLISVHRAVSTTSSKTEYCTPRAPAHTRVFRRCPHPTGAAPRRTPDSCPLRDGASRFAAVSDREAVLALVCASRWQKPWRLPQATCARLVAGSRQRFLPDLVAATQAVESRVRAFPTCARTVSAADVQAIVSSVQSPQHAHRAAHPVSGSTPSTPPCPARLNPAWKRRAPSNYAMLALI